MATNRSTIHLKTSRTACVELVGNPPEATELWVVLHGYGETATDFISHFNEFASEKRLFVAPEGLSRFYKRGMCGAVGASWMTRRDRKFEIRDYLGYLDEVYRIVQAEASHLTQVNVLGFSQGVATAIRWAAQKDGLCDQLVLWGAGIPEDVSLADVHEKVLTLTVVLGDEDSFISEADIERERSRLISSELNAEFLRYEGGHTIDQDTLRQIVLGDKRGG